MPKTLLQFQDGTTLSVGTVSCDDQIHQAVYLAYTPCGASTPTLELELPPKAVEIIIQKLQEYSNQARFVNGERMLEYPKPYPAPSLGTSRRPRKVKKSNEKKGQQSASPGGGPAKRLGNSNTAKEPPSLS